MTFEEVNIQICDAIKAELRAQGHYDTGALEASITPVIVSEGSNMVLTASALGYLGQLEEGVPASQISINDADLSKIKAWSIRRGMAFNDRQADKVVALIIRRWKQEGMPTENSRAFSSTGFRTEAVKDAFDDHDQQFVASLDNAAIGGLDAIFLQSKSGVV